MYTWRLFLHLFLPPPFVLNLPNFYISFRWRDIFRTYLYFHIHPHIRSSSGSCSIYFVLYYFIVFYLVTWLKFPTWDYKWLNWTELSPSPLHLPQVPHVWWPCCPIRSWPWPTWEIHAESCAIKTAMPFLYRTTTNLTSSKSARGSRRLVSETFLSWFWATEQGIRSNWGGYHRSDCCHGSIK